MLIFFFKALDIAVVRLEDYSSNLYLSLIKLGSLSRRFLNWLVVLALTVSVFSAFHAGATLDEKKLFLMLTYSAL